MPCRGARGAVDRDALPGRGGDAGALHREGAPVPRHGERGRRDHRRRQRLDRRLGRLGAAARRPGGRGRRPGLRLGAPRRDPGRPGHVRRDGRRRRQLRLLRPRTVRHRAAGRRRPGDGGPLRGRHRGGRHAGAPPLRRQPGPVLPRPAVLPIGHPGLPLRAAGLPPRRHPRPRPAVARHGVRQRDGGQGHAERPERDPGADPPVPRRPQPPAPPAHLARRLAPPPLPAPLQPALAVLLPGPGAPARRRSGGGGADVHGHHDRHRHVQHRDAGGLHGPGAHRLPVDVVRAAVEVLRQPGGPAPG